MFACPKLLRPSYPQFLKYFYTVIIFLFLFFALNPGVSFAQRRGFFFKTGMGTFYLPTFNPFIFFTFPNNDKNLEKIIEKNIANTSFKFGIVIENHTTGQKYFLNQDEKFKTASLYKPMLMETLYDLFNSKELERTVEIDKKIENMITVSSNEDAWYLAELVGWNTIEKTMKKIGLTNTSMDNPPITTPEDVALFLRLLQQNKLVSKEVSLEMKKIMLDQKINDRIPKLLPQVTKVAHKTGEYEEVRHDTGIVYTDNNMYSIILMSKNVTDENEAEVKNIMAQISKEVYDYFEHQWDNIPKIL